MKTSVSLRRQRKVETQNLASHKKVSPILSMPCCARVLLWIRRETQDFASLQVGKSFIVNAILPAFIAMGSTWDARFYNHTRLAPLRCKAKGAVSLHYNPLHKNTIPAVKNIDN